MVRVISTHGLGLPPDAIDQDIDGVVYEPEEVPLGQRPKATIEYVEESFVERTIHELGEPLTEI